MRATTRSPCIASVRLRGGDVDVAARRLERALGHDEAVTRAGASAAGRRTRSIFSGRPKRLPRIWMSRRGDERLEVPPERRRAPAAAPEHLQQLAAGRGMVSALADERQHLIARKHAQGCVMRRSGDCLERRGPQACVRLDASAPRNADWPLRSLQRGRPQSLDAGILCVRRSQHVDDRGHDLASTPRSSAPPTPKLRLYEIDTAAEHAAPRVGEAEA